MEIVLQKLPKYVYLLTQKENKRKTDPQLVVRCIEFPIVTALAYIVVVSSVGTEYTEQLHRPLFFRVQGQSNQCISKNQKLDGKSASTYDSSLTLWLMTFILYLIEKLVFLFEANDFWSKDLIKDEFVFVSYINSLGTSDFIQTHSTDFPYW